MKPVNHSKISYVIFFTALLLTAGFSSSLSFPVFFYVLSIENVFLKSLLVLPVFVFSILLLINLTLLQFGVMSYLLVKFFRIKNDKSVLESTIYLVGVPLERLMGFLPAQLKVFFIRLHGGKVGKNVKICHGVRIFNPYLVEIGDNVVIGMFAVISAHIEEKGVYTLKKVRIGNNVLIGGGSWILPGVVIDDDVMIGIDSVIPKNKHLSKGTVWIGKKRV